MTDQEYLEAVLQDQTLAENSAELRNLRQHRMDVENLLRDKFGFTPSIRYGGSYQKGTMIRESYDLDITCYFPRDYEGAGTTLREIYETVEEALREKYWTNPKGSAIRLQSRNDVRADFHIDAVPGRFVNGKDGDVNLYRSTGEKAYLKTNLDTHIRHVQNSGVISAIRLLKLWALRNHVGIKTFVLELLVIVLLEGRKSRSLGNQLDHVLTQFRDHGDDLSVEDPANPYGNDLSELLNSTVRWSLETAARATLELVERDGWQAVFGEVEAVKRQKKAAALAAMAAATPVRPKPYRG